MRTWFCHRAFLVLVFFVLCSPLPPSVSALEEGTVTGKIERTDASFRREYEALDYKGQSSWQEWAKGLQSFGWVVVKGDSGQLKDYLLIVVDTRTRIIRKDGAPGAFEDLMAGGEVTINYRMGWDALHAIDLRIPE